MSEVITVLLAEDEADEKVFFVEGLKKIGVPHKTIWAKNYDELFELLEKETNIDLLIVDLDMPGKNGKECLKDIKSNDKYKALPVIILTVSKNTDDINEVYQNGAHYYAIKPYSEVNYLETLRKIFSIDWKKPHPVPPKDDFIINLAFV